MSSMDSDYFIFLGGGEEQSSLILILQKDKSDSKLQSQEG